MTADCLSVIDALGEWSKWVPISEAPAVAPRLPGVYMARDGAAGPVIYVGMAGERRGSGNSPQGIRGRFVAYLSGRGLVSGLGEAVIDRALADPVWLGERLAEAKRGEAMKVKEWAKAAILRTEIYVRWMTTADKTAAAALETECLRLLADSGLWNRRR